MKARPILMSAPMVLALLEGRKTQTRRAVKPAPISVGHRPLISFNRGVPEWSFGPEDRDERGLRWWRCPYGAPGDLLWVREAFTVVPETAYRMSEGVQQTVNPSDRYYAAIYAAGWDRSIPKWKPSIFMPRWASRLTLEITEIRVERLQEISPGDAKAEGLEWVAPTYGVGGIAASWNGDPRLAYAGLWEAINGPGSWDANPWVWALSFRVHKANVDAVKETDQ